MQTAVGMVFVPHSPYYCMYILFVPLGVHFFHDVVWMLLTGDRYLANDLLEKNLKTIVNKLSVLCMRQVQLATNLSLLIKPKAC